jgi:hypothetical protein
VLAVEGRHDLARIKVGKGHDLHFGEAEGVFDNGNHAHHDGIIDRTAEHWRHLDLDLHAARPNDELGDDILDPAEREALTSYGGDAPLDPFL